MIRTHAKITATDQSHNAAIARHRVACLLQAATLLDPVDADLLVARFSRCESHPQIAQRLGIQPNSVSRRIRLLTEWVESRLFQAIVSGLARLPTVDRDIARIVFLQRRPYGDAAAETGLTYAAVRTRMRTLRLWQHLLLREPEAARALAESLHHPKATTTRLPSGRISVETEVAQ